MDLIDPWPWEMQGGQKRKKKKKNTEKGWGVQWLFGYGEGKDKIQVNSREMRGEELAAAPTQTILSRAFSKKGSRVLEC